MPNRLLTPDEMVAEVIAACNRIGKENGLIDEEIVVLIIEAGRWLAHQPMRMGDEEGSG